MTRFENAQLEKLGSPATMVAIAREVNRQAVELVDAGEITENYLKSEIYVPGVELPSRSVDRSLYEISHYSDGFGASLFTTSEEMLYLSSNHEVIAEAGIGGDRISYLEPLFAGAPKVWSQVFNMLVDERRFEYNQPSGVFWFRNGDWHLTDLANEITRPGSDLEAYSNGLTEVETVDLAYLFDHVGKTGPDQAVIDRYFADWRS